MRQVILMFGLLTVLALPAAAQTPAPVLPTPEEQKAFQAARDDMRKAADALAAAVDKLPEAAAAKKALAALEEARAKLPETKAQQAASDKMLDLAYQLMAKKGLSSREWEPKLSPKGELEFHKSKQ